MKKFLLLVAAVMAITLLSVPAVCAKPSPTEPDRPTGTENSDASGGDRSEEFEDSHVPLSDRLADSETPSVPLPEELVEIEDEDVPLAHFAPQTGVTGLRGMEALALTAIAFTASGVVVLVKAGKQTGSVR